MFSWGQNDKKIVYLSLDSTPLLCYPNNTSRGRAEVARRAHNPEVGGSNPSPATKYVIPDENQDFLFVLKFVVELFRGSLYGKV